MAGKAGRMVYMSDDLISRKQTVEMLRKYAESKFANDEVELANGILKAANYIENDNIPTAYDVEWIPASERLPDIAKEVLVTYQNGDIAVDFIHSDCGWFWEDKEEAGEVIAWRPLPKPYKEVKQE